MSSIQKRQLKLAKEAIQAENYEYSQQLSKDILQYDSNNYNALVFLGISNSKLNLVQEAVDAYESAIKSNPKLPLAYQGLKKLYESEHDYNGVLRILEMQSNLILGDIEMKGKYLEYLDSQTEIARKLDDPQRLVNILSRYLPSSEQYHFISGSITSAKLAVILREIIDLKTSILSDNIRKAISERRLRLDAEPLVILTRKVVNYLI